MARRNFLALIFIIFSSCTVDLPIEYHISAKWLQYPEEAQTIQDAAEEWNKATCLQMFHFVGYSEDVEFDLDDLQDDWLTIYAVWDAENPDANKVSDLSYAGYSIGDIIIRRYAVSGTAAYRWKNFNGHPESEVVTRKYYLALLKSVVTHEFGHQMLRPVFGHNREENGLSIMDPSSGSIEWAFKPTKLDVDQICSFYNCPPAKECPTRPTF